ncbi:MAG: DegQ family serine endoprotease [Nitrospirota bacterium]
MKKRNATDVTSSLFIRLVLGFMLLCIFYAYENVPAQEKGVSSEARTFLDRMSRSLAEVAEVAKPSVVNISTTMSMNFEDTPFGGLLDDPFFRKFFGENFDRPGPKKGFKSSALGSGVIISEDGYILTGHHVVENAEEIKVVLGDKREFRGRVIGSDPPTDVAVIKIDAKGLPAIKMGDSRALKAGDVVLAIGNPFGLNQTITMGIVSAIGRTDIGIADYEDFIQIDAAVNPGNSGGALVNTGGELVGINTAIFSTSGGSMGVGFAIPSAMANTVAQGIIRHGKVVRGWLGVSVQDLTAELAQSLGIRQEQGALVTEVMKGSPAEKAGLKRGDLIVGFRGKAVENSSTLRNTVANTPPGTKAELKIIRGGKEETLSITVEELTPPKAAQRAAYKNALRGIHVQELTPEMREALNAPKDMKGVIVTSISWESPARQVLRKNDIIQEVNRKPVSGLQEYESIVSKIGPDETVLLLVYRNGGSLYVTIKP